MISTCPQYTTIYKQLHLLPFSHSIIMKLLLLTIVCLIVVLNGSLVKGDVESTFPPGVVFPYELRVEVRHVRRGELFSGVPLEGNLTVTFIDQDRGGSFELKWVSHTMNRVSTNPCHKQRITEHLRIEIRIWDAAEVGWLHRWLQVHWTRDRCSQSNRDDGHTWMGGCPSNGQKVRSLHLE